MTFLRSIELAQQAPGPEAGHPFDVGAIVAMATHGHSVRFNPAVTIFVGDNGSGKSTLLEALAVHQGMNAEGGARGMQFQTHEASVSPLHQHVRVLRTSEQPRDAFFLRAESYFNVATAIEEYGGDTPARYGGSPHHRSHGESFIDLAVHRFRPRSLILLDEPESALSVHGQLQLLVRMHDLVAQRCQFVIATHSPMLMAFPGASIHQFDETGIRLVEWSDIDTVNITSDFLANPTEFLHELLTDDD
ncbi:MAG: AAA family ATPase [Actinomycetota bacterium]